LVTLRSIIATALLLWILASVANAAGPQIYLFRQAGLDAGPVRLGDIARVTGGPAEQQRLENLIVGRVSPSTKEANFGIAEIREALVRVGIPPAGVDIYGASYCHLIVNPSQENLAKAEEQREPEGRAPLAVEDPLEERATLKDALDQMVALQSGINPSKLITEWRCLRRPKVLQELAPEGRFQLKPQTAVGPGKVYFEVIDMEAQSPEVLSGARRPVVCRVYGKVVYQCESVVAIRAIRAGQKIMPGDVEVRPRRVKSQREAGIEDLMQVVGQEAARSISANTVVTDKMIRKLRLVKRNDLVDVVYENGVVRMSMRCKAKREGGLGDVIPVMNIVNKSTLQGRVVGPGKLSMVLDEPTLPALPIPFGSTGSVRGDKK